MDTPPDEQLSRELLGWFTKEFPGIKITAVVVNHFHADCLGGLRVFHEAGIASYANVMTNESIKDDSVVKPQNTITNKHLAMQKL